jgi:hypothetical protein
MFIQQSDCDADAPPDLWLLGMRQAGSLTKRRSLVHNSRANASVARAATKRESIFAESPTYAVSWAARVTTTQARKRCAQGQQGLEMTLRSDLGDDASTYFFDAHHRRLPQQPDQDAFTARLR